MSHSIIRTVLAGVTLTAFALAQPAIAQLTNDEEPLNLLDGTTSLEDKEKSDVEGLVPLFVPKDEPSETENPDDPQTEEPELLTRDGVLLRGLDKITGESTDLTVKTGEQVIFGGLRVTVRACHQTPPTEAPESIAYVEIEDYGFRLEESALTSEEVDKEKRVFNGWMYASSPGIHALEHPIYDIWVIRCMAAEPDLSDDSSKS